MGDVDGGTGDWVWLGAALAGVALGRGVGRVDAFTVGAFATGTGWMDTYRPSQIIGIGA